MEFEFFEMHLEMHLEMRLEIHLEIHLKTAFQDARRESICSIKLTVQILKLNAFSHWLSPS